MDQLYITIEAGILIGMGEPPLLVEPAEGVLGGGLAALLREALDQGPRRREGAPLLVGVSRKSMVYKALGTGPEEALNGTTALHAWALDRGAHFLRVHDVEAAREVLTLFRQFHPAPLPGPWPA